MKVFISWSGTPSRQLAEALRWWLPKVIQGTMPFVSAKDIDKGSNWIQVLSEELKDTDFGVVCLTPENISSPWLNYEAGAITKSVDSRVCPLLLGLEKKDISGPLSQLQVTALDLDDVLLMLRSLNKAGGSGLTDADLEEAARMWWPRLQERVDAIDIPPVTTALVNAPEPAKPQSSESEILQEILDRVRHLDRRLVNLERDRRRTTQTTSRYASEQDVLRLLRNEGVLATEIDQTPKGIAVRADEVPEPLTMRAFSMLSDMSKSRGVPVTIEGGGRFVEFTPDGNVSEPPF